MLVVTLLEYREPLPENCPPAEATEIRTARRFYRLVEDDAPTEGDFESWRARNPTKGLPRGMTECAARGVSIYSDRSGAERQLNRVPKFRGHRICTVRLGAGAGPIKRTVWGSHHTWWPLAGFDILDHCLVEGSEA